MEFNGFIVPTDCEKALKELNKLAVCKYRNDDCEENFADVWFHVQHECDMYEEGQASNCLNSRSYIAAKNWMGKYKHLYYKYESK